MRASTQRPRLSHTETMSDLIRWEFITSDKGETKQEHSGAVR